MANLTKGIAILGSTGSVGTQTLDIVRAFPDRFRVVALAARRSLDTLHKQIKEFRPKLIYCEGTPDQLRVLSASGCKHASLDDIVQHPDIDIVVTATVGDVALKPTCIAIECGKTIAIANKETIVMAGPYITKLARKRGVKLLPLDSEPSAIWQCLRGENKKISKLILTASGGAFRRKPLADLERVSASEALEHPTWNMGAKITIDSATMMNKAFEVIEAKWLFETSWEQVEVVIHPQSVIHSMVEFADGSVKAQISPPDMRLPIQYALLYPDRVYNESIGRFDPVKTGALTFEAWDNERYPCFDMALSYAKRGGTWPAALSGADDAAVSAFLNEKIRFTDIGAVVRKALETHRNIEAPTPDDMLAAAEWARSRVKGITEE
jgi:1-deoxy-D-xylulose-5-phosphate reductoisomerase